MSAKTASDLIVYRGFLGSSNYVWSPFVNKLEARLRLGGVSYSVKPGSRAQAPRQKVPYLGFEHSNELLADTTLITRKLIDNGVLSDLNANLDPVQRAQDLMIRALLEDKLYFYLVRERWMDNFYTIRDKALEAIPYVVRILVGNLAYRGTMSMLYGQGTNRFQPDEVRELKLEVWENLNALLADARNKTNAALARNRNEPFWVLGRPDPTEADATVYAWIVSSLFCAAAPETQKVVRTFPVLVDYARRIHYRYFADYEVWQDEV